MFLLEPDDAGSAPDLVFSATDLVAASECEYRTLRVLDEKLGRAPKAEFPADEMQARAGELGDRHEQTVLDSLTARYGTWDPNRAAGVYSLERGPNLRGELQARHAETELALRSGADVVFQATFFDGEFLGYADFLVNEAAGTGNTGRYEVWDTKLARHAKVGALLQLAAYGDQLLGMGLDPSPVVTLVLGTRVGSDWLRSSHPLPDLLPVFRERRRRFRELTARHRAGADPVRGGSPGVAHCGRCDYCAEQVQVHRDLLMVAGMSVVRRRKLNAEGIATIDELAAMPAAATGPVARLRAQARMQLGLDAPAGSRTYTKDGDAHTVSYSVLPEHTIGTLPPPSPGDIFFDFEGDPLWQDPATGAWGMEYLFGVDRARARTLSRCSARSGRTPRSGETAGLPGLPRLRGKAPGHLPGHARLPLRAVRKDRAAATCPLAHQAGEDTIDAWLREGLLVDLYDTVRHSLRISEPSYSIKKLEPLYMGENLRAGDVKDAGASVVAYADYCAARDAGHADEAATVLESISDYNQYDCLSTLRLRDWLLALGATADGGTRPGQPPGTLRPRARYPNGRPPRMRRRRRAEEAGCAPTWRRCRTTGPWTDDERAIAMVAAATGYHRREGKQFWWQHFDRLEAPVDAWAGPRNVFVVD